MDYASSSLLLLPDLLGGRDLSWFPAQSTSWSLSTFAAELARFGQVLYHWESLYSLLQSSCPELCPKDSSPGQLSSALCPIFLPAIPHGQWDRGMMCCAVAQGLVNRWAVPNRCGLRLNSVLWSLLFLSALPGALPSAGRSAWSRPTQSFAGAFCLLLTETWLVLLGKPEAWKRSGVLSLHILYLLPELTHCCANLFTSCHCPLSLQVTRALERSRHPFLKSCHL